MPSNLILEFHGPIDYAKKDEYCFWHDKQRNGNLLAHLKRLKKGLEGKRLARFMLDSKWEEKGFWKEPLYNEIWSEILRDVSEVFGDELMVVICCEGEDVQKDFRDYAPRDIRELEFFDRPLGPQPVLNAEDESVEETSTTPRTRTLRHSRDPLPPINPQPVAPRQSGLSIAAPLHIHCYSGYRLVQADIRMGYALSMFANKNLKSLYFSSDPNNFSLLGHGRRPAEGHELYKMKNQFFPGNPWRHLLPSLSSVCETLESITLDCSLFWSELAYCLPHLYKLKHLDCELALLHTEPMYPFQLETKEVAGNRILETCLSSENTTKKERALKKNKGKKWIQIDRTGIVLPRIEPEVRDMPMDVTMRDRFNTVDIKVCLQVIRRRIARSRRK